MLFNDVLKLAYTAVVPVVSVAVTAWNFSESLTLTDLIQVVGAALVTDTVVSAIAPGMKSLIEPLVEVMAKRAYSQSWASHMSIASSSFTRSLGIFLAFTAVATTVANVATAVLYAPPLVVGAVIGIFVNQLTATLLGASMAVAVSSFDGDRNFQYFMTKVLGASQHPSSNTIFGNQSQKFLLHAALALATVALVATKRDWLETETLGLPADDISDKLRNALLADYPDKLPVAGTNESAEFQKKRETVMKLHALLTDKDLATFVFEAKELLVRVTHTADSTKIPLVVAYEAARKAKTIKDVKSTLEELTEKYDDYANHIREFELLPAMRELLDKTVAQRVEHLIDASATSYALNLAQLYDAVEGGLGHNAIATFENALNENLGWSKNNASEQPSLKLTIKNLKDDRKKLVTYLESVLKTGVPISVSDDLVAHILELDRTAVVLERKQQENTADLLAFIYLTKEMGSHRGFRPPVGFTGFTTTGRPDNARIMQMYKAVFVPIGDSSDAGGSGDGSAGAGGGSDEDPPANESSDGAGVGGWSGDDSPDDGSAGATGGSDDDQPANESSADEPAGADESSADESDGESVVPNDTRQKWLRRARMIARMEAANRVGPKLRQYESIDEAITKAKEAALQKADELGIPPKKTKPKPRPGPRRSRRTAGNNP